MEGHPLEHPDYLEHQEGPDGQSCDLLTRVPYDNQRILEYRLATARSVRDQEDAALRGMLWTEHHPPKVKHVLTGEWTDDIGKASAEIVQPWRERAMELYNAWYEIAFPTPKKGSRQTGRSTRTGSPPSETSAAS